MVYKSNPKNTEQKEFYIYDPKNIKKSIEIVAKPKPSPEELIIVEKPGKVKRVNKIKAKPKLKSKIFNKAIKNAKNPGSSKNSKNVESVKNIKINQNNGKYILIITEKPQAAEKIAAALSEGKDKKISKRNKVSYYEFKRNNQSIIVACAVGHLFSVSQKIKGTKYPIFDIGWFPNFEVRKKDFTKRYYDTIKDLIKKASEIIIATDFDIEGEVIGYNILRFIANKEDAKRMKFSTLTVSEIQKAYDNVNPNIEWGQAIAGETRHFLDWLYGINLSRALMNSIKTMGKFRIMSIGRVQGPTLNFIVNKEKEIKKFKPSPYWQVFIEVNDEENKLELKHNKEITKKQELNKFKNLKDKKISIKIEKIKQKIQPPAPFNLTALQMEAYKFYKISPAQTLRVAQKLYLAGLISYPRTSSQKIPKEMNPEKILKKLSKHFPELIKYKTRAKPIEGKKSDSAHPACIPTGNWSGNLAEDEKKIYNLIVKRFISCFCNDLELEIKKVTGLINKLKFSTRGIEILKSGWNKVYPIKIEEKEIPNLKEEAEIKKIKTEEKQTKPPNRYSPASILKELEKKNLGTKATRANILETLYDRNYIKDRSIRATELGIRLIDSLKKHSPIIVDEKLTRELEKDMDSIKTSKKDLIKKQGIVIQKAEKNLTKISEDFKKQEKEIGKELIEANQALWDQEEQENKLGVECFGCKKGEFLIKYSPRFKSYFIGCSSYPDCKQTCSLPSKSLIKKAGKNCEKCNWPMLISIKKARRPWVFCFNPNCPSKKEKAESKDK